VIGQSSLRRVLVGFAGKGRRGDAGEWKLAGKQQRSEAPRRHAEEQAARRQKEAQELWRRAQRERRRAEFFWGETRKERRRAEAAWRRLLTGVDPAAPKVRISAADRDRLVKILDMPGSDQPGEVASAARHAEAIWGKLAVSWDEALAATAQVSRAQRLAVGARRPGGGEFRSANSAVAPCISGPAVRPKRVSRKPRKAVRGVPCRTPMILTDLSRGSVSL
jgi:hypothetical protein